MDSLSLPDADLHRTPLSSFRSLLQTLCVAAIVVLLTGPLPAQTPDQPVDVPPPPSNASQNLSPADLDQLLGPIALYPDALVGLILPASTVPSDVVLGARYLEANGDPNQVADQPWDDSVKGLVRYPDVLSWMDKNLQWTTAVGEAFVSQPADVMNSIQRLRAEAQAKGNLTNTPQQQVVQDQSSIRIVPADPDVIYVPQYDPEVVYTQAYAPDYGPLLTFGAGFAVGSWLAYDFDWNHHNFYHGHWRGWNDNGHSWNGNNHWYGGGGGNNVNVVNITNVNRWQPSANSTRQFHQLQRQNNGNARFVNSAHSGNRTTVNSGSVPVNNRLPRPTQLTVSSTRNNGHVHSEQSATHVGTNGHNNGRVPEVTTAPQNVSNTTVNHHGHTGSATHVSGFNPPTDAPRVAGELNNPAQTTHSSSSKHHGSSSSSSSQLEPFLNSGNSSAHHAATSSSHSSSSSHHSNVPKTEPAPAVESHSTSHSSHTQSSHHESSSPSHASAPTQSHHESAPAPSHHSSSSSEHHSSQPASHSSASHSAPSHSAPKASSQPAHSSSSSSKSSSSKKSDKKDDN